MPNKINYEIPTKYYSHQPGGFTPIFAINDFILIEGFTGKSYTYKVLNLNTGEIKHLYHAKNKLLKEKHIDVACKICGYEITAENTLSNEQRNEYEKHTDRLKHIFINIMTRYGYNIREKQIELAEQMLGAIYSRQIAIAEAEVGTGKTHAYILASIFVALSKKNDMWIRSLYRINSEFHSDTPMPFVISTSSIALQKAITKDYIPEISGILIENSLIDKPLSCVIRKGKEHYICDARLEDHIAGIKRIAAKPFNALLSTSHFKIDLGEIDSISPVDKKKINVTNQCNPNCGKYGKCRYMRFLEYAKSSIHDFQVCNHNYLIADIRRREQGDRPLIPNYQGVIIDEAHKFQQAAQQMYGGSFSNFEAEDLAINISKLSFNNKSTELSMQNDCEKLSHLNKRLFKLLNKGIPKIKDYDDDAERFKTIIGKQTISTIKGMLFIIEGISEQINKNYSTLARNEHLYSYVLWLIKSAKNSLQAFLQPDEIVYWLEISKLNYNDTKKVSLIFIPKGLNQLLNNDLWSKQHPIVLTSGTLSVSGCFSHIKKNMGIDLVPENRLLETSKSSPFDYKENCLIYISERVPFPDNKSPAYVEAVANEIERLILATQGHTAVLFTSFKIMELVYKMIAERNTGFQLIMLNKGSLNPIEVFRKSTNGVLFASGSMWEGIDLPGDILSSLIIVKLPFSVPDPVSEYEQSQYDSVSEYKRTVVLPGMILKLKQGFGRLIRKETDSGIVSILDSRIKNGGPYRQRVLDALPDCKVTSNIGDVRRFIRRKKNRSYFEIRGYDYEV